MGVRNALTFVGAVVGGFFGPAGAQLGMAIGGIIGGMVDPQEVRLPGLRDIQIQRQGEGQPIVELAGTAGGAGTLIYCSDPDIRQVKEKQGKGTSAVTVQDRVYLTFALQIGSSIFDGPGHREGRKRLIKIRLGDKLVYDVSPTSEILAESAEFAKCFTYYPGDYTQLPDPHIEAIEGVGNVSAYRGTAYVVFHNFDATDYGGVPPQFFFETADDGTEVLKVALITNRRHYSGHPTDLEVGSADIGFPAGTDVVAMNPKGVYAAGADKNSMVDGRFSWFKFDESTGTWSQLPGPTDMPSRGPLAMAWSWSGEYLAVVQGTAPRLIIYKREGDTLTKLPDPDPLLTASPSAICWARDDQRIVIGVADTANPIRCYDFIPQTGQAINFRTTVNAGTIGNGGTRVAFMPTAGARYVASAGSSAIMVWDVTESPMRLAAYVHDLGDADGDAGIHWHSSGAYVISVGLNNGPNFVRIWEFDGSTIGAESLTFVSAAADQPSGAVNSAMTPEGQYLVIANIVAQPFLLGFTGSLPPAGTQLSIPPNSAGTADVSWAAFPDPPQVEAGYTTYADIVKAVGRRCGIPDSAWELPGLDEKIVRGFAVGSQQYTGADAINALRLVFPSDVACFDGKIHIFLRGGAVDMELDDQFQVDEGLDAESGELLQNGDEVRKTPARLPTKVNLMFPNATMGYAMTKATSPDDGDGPSLSEVTLEVPVVLDEETEAPQLADILAKISRTEAEGEFGGLYPMDIALAAATGTVVRHTSGGVQRRTVVKGFRYYDGKVRLTLGLDRPADYQSNASARPSAGWPKPPPSLVGETVAAVLNAPALLDTHDQIGVYAAISGQPGTAWHGCRIDYRLAGATNWQSLGVFTTRSVMGILLQDFAAGAAPYPDHSHHLVVRLLHDDIIESQSTIDWLNRAGGLAIVRPDGTVELVQSQFADHIDAQDWDLSCHQRGRLGTSADAHAAGARVVWLDSVIWLPLPETVIGQTLQFRFVAFGSTEETAPVHTITLDPPISQRELPVANLVLTREGGTITGAWWERKRFGTDINPIRSASWAGFLVTLTDGSTTESFETTEPGFSRPDSAFSGPITVTVAQLNRYTGAGPSISETI